LLIVGDDSNSLLHEAVIHKNLDFIRVLVRCNLSFRYANTNGITPLQLALNNNDWDCILAMAESCAAKSPDLPELRALLIPALRANQPDVVRALLKLDAGLEFFKTEDGIKYFLGMLADKQSGKMISILLEECKADLIKSLLIRYGKVHKDFVDCFDDPVELEEIRDPVMTKQGSTYERSVFIHVCKMIDPQTREKLTMDQLAPNSLYADLLAYYKQPCVDITKIPPCLICPETGEVYKDPVFTSDGKTYEKAYILRYLAENYNLSPTKTLEPAGRNFSRGEFQNQLVIEILKKCRPEHEKTMVSVTDVSLFSTAEKQKNSGQSGAQEQHLPQSGLSP
jgi:hypothetical protein